MADDMRFYQTFYGIYTNDWSEDWGGITDFTDHKYLMIKDYMSEGCSTEEGSDATSAVITFLYPYHIKKQYYIEGIVEGHITLAASALTATITSYQVEIHKMDSTGADTLLASTGVVAIGDTLAWDSTYNVGEEMVYPFWIDCYDKKELDENDRLYVSVNVTCGGGAWLMHSNDSTWEDFKITFPFLL